MITKRPAPHTLYAFEAAARHNSFSKAANELQITQPAVSRAIAALEAETGEQLFHRSGPTIRLTQKGAELSSILSSTFQSVDGLFARWRAQRNRGTVLLSISSSMASHWLIPRLFEFRRIFPDVELRFELIAGAVGDGPVMADLGLRRWEAGRPTSTETLYLPEIIQPMASPEYLRRTVSLDSPSARRPHTLISLSDHWCDWETFAANSGLVLPKEHTHLRFSDYSVALESAINGQGVVLGWLSVTSRLIRSGKLLAASDAFFASGANYNLLTNESYPPNDLVEKVRKWMQDEVRADLLEIRKSRPAFAFARKVALISD
ncbi:LysR family transcriptional regulator [Agrobacterium sp. 22-223-1]